MVKLRREVNRIKPNNKLLNNQLLRDYQIVLGKKYWKHMKILNNLMLSKKNQRRNLPYFYKTQKKFKGRQLNKMFLLLSCLKVNYLEWGDKALLFPNQNLGSQTPKFSKILLKYQK